MSTVTVKNTFVDVLDGCDDFDDVGPSNFSRGITEPALNKLRQSLRIYAPPSEKAAVVDVVAGESQDNLPMLSGEDASEATNDNWARLGTPGDYLTRLVTHDPMHDNFDKNFDSLVEEEEELLDLAHAQLSSDYGRNGVAPGLTEMKSPPLGAVRAKEPTSHDEAFSRLATPSDPFTRLQTPGGEFTRLVTQDPLWDMDFRSGTRLAFSQQMTQPCAAEVKPAPSTRGGLSPQSGPKKFGAGTEVKLAPPPAQSRSTREEAAATPAKSAMGQSPVMQMMYQPQMMMMPWPGSMYHMQQQQQSVQQQQEDGYSSDKTKRQKKKKAAPVQSQFRGRPSLIDMAMNQKQHIQMMLEEQNRDDPIVGRCSYCSGEVRASFKFCRYCGGAC